MNETSRRDFLGLLGLSALGAGALLLPADALSTEPSGALGDYEDWLRAETAEPDGGGETAEGPHKEPKWLLTEDNILGPYYRRGAPYRAKITPPLAAGTVLLIKVRVWGLDTRRPLAGAVLDIWQADTHGRYDNDDRRNPPKKGVFKNRARVVADERGNYEYETILPGRYLLGPERWRPRHIHYLVRHPGYRTLVTQLYFKGDPHNRTDPFIKRSLVIDTREVKTPTGAYRKGHFDIVLGKGKEQEQGAQWKNAYR